jgi:hypothetical protein
VCIILPEDEADQYIFYTCISDFVTALDNEVSWEGLVGLRI